MTVVITGKHTFIRSLSNSKQNVSLSDPGHGNHFAALEHRCEIQEILTGMDLVLVDFGNLGRQKPVAVAVVLEFRWDHECTARRFTSNRFYPCDGFVPARRPVCKT